MSFFGGTVTPIREGASPVLLSLDTCALATSCQETDANNTLAPDQRQTELLRIYYEVVSCSSATSTQWLVLRSRRLED